jgi:hypothetical protein
MRATAFAQDDFGREIAEMPAGQHALGERKQFLFFGGRGDAGHGAGSWIGLAERLEHHRVE